MQVRTIAQKKTTTVAPEQRADMIKKARKEHDKLVKGMFEFIDAQGGWLEFGYRIFPGEAPSIFKFVHGEICEIPMGLVKHLNNTKKKIRKMSMMLDPDGKLPRGQTNDYEVQSRVRFTPVDVL